MAAPELRLNVSLDLGFFRQQLRQLSTVASSEFNAPLKVKFDKTSLNNELRLLTNQLSRRKYAIQINDTSIKAARVNAQKLKNTLDLLTKQKYIVNVEYQQKGGPAGTGGGTQRSAGFASARQQVSNLTAEQLRNRAFQSLGKESRSAQQVSQWLDTVLQQGLKGGAKKKQLDAIRDYLADALASSARGGVEARMRGQGFGGAGKVQRSALDQIARAVFFMAGIDPAKVRAERRRIPSIDWQATAPSRGRSTGPSSTGRMLPPGYTPPGLPGTAIGSQRLLIGDILDPSLKNAAREAANSFVDTIRKGLNEAVRAVNVRDLGNALRPALTGSRVAGFLAPGVGRVSSPYGTGRLGRDGETRAELFARREREARMRSALRGVDVMGEGGVAGRPPSSYGYAYRGARPQSAIVPYAAGGAMVYSGPGGGGGGTGGGPGNFAGRGGGAGGGFNMPNLPGAGLVREIGEEFAFATKQVLLYGQAYKLLGFFQDLPNQVGQAVGQLQSFRNTLDAVSTSAEEARASNELILSIVERYNIPLQSAREGFTKLYASMAPAGFGGEEIRGLFTGISKAAATFGMSADKVDRVNYAFAQMASKGQVMSEELKGQLGDVLPGAMAIFAEAAGFKGPDAISKFSAALEDGRYKGEAMVALLNNVSIVMNDKFAKGADGAAKTFQGAINNMQTSLKFFYESLEPIAVQFLNGFIRPLSGGLKTITDGLNAFFTGAAAKTSGGFAIAQELEGLRPTFDGLRQNATELIQVFGQFAKIALEVGKVLLQIAGNPVVGYLAKLYAIFLPINLALNVMRGLWAANALQLVIFNARVVTGTSTLTAFRGMMAATGATAATTAASIRGAGITLRTFFATTGIGIVLVGVSMLIERFMSMNQALEDTKNKALGAAQAIRAMSSVEARASEFSTARVIKDLKQLQQSKDSARLRGKTVTRVPGEVVKRLEAAGVPVQRDILGQTTIDPSMIPSYMLQQEGLKSEARYRQTELQFEEKQLRQDLAPIPAATGDSAGGGSGGGAAKLDIYDQSKLQFIDAQLEKEKQILEQKRQQNLMSETAYQIAVAELELESAIQSATEQLRVSKIAINRDNLSTGDKLLKIKDAEIAKENVISIATTKRNIAVQGARKELEGPFNDAIDAANFSIKEQEALLENIKNGVAELTPEQQAYLQVLGLTKDKTEDELGLLQNKITLLEGAIEKQNTLNRAVEQEKILLGLRNQLTMAQIFDPNIELREQIRQENPLLTGPQVEEQALLQERVNAAQKYKEAMVGAASAIGNAFAEAFKGVVSGSMTAQQALASFFQSTGDYFIDMAARMIAEWLKMQLIQGLTNFVGGIFGGGGFGGNALGSSSANVAQYAPLPGMGYANGGIAMGGFTAFANGGMVTGPTMGLVGEGRYNEAIVPLPNGKSIPVELGGAAGNQMNTNITVNVNNGQAQSNATGSNSSELGRKIEGAVKQVIVGELRPGGLLASR